MSTDQGDSDAFALMQQLWQHETSYRTDLFDGKTVLISGGGSGIGRAAALLFSRLGARVAICGRKQARLDAVTAFADSKGHRILGIATDIREPPAIESLLDKIDSTLGTLDILINNAGGQFAQPAIDFSQRGWNAVIENNLHGTWYMMQLAARHWRDAGRGGTIVNIIAPVERGMPGVAHTAAARAGVIGAMNTVAVEWAPLKIRINCLCPGLTASEGLGVYPPAAVAEFSRANPLRRMASLSEIAEGCVFLASPHCEFITGEVLNIDGGFRLWGELWLAGRPDYFRDS